VAEEDLDDHVVAARARDPKAWTEIYRNAYPRLYSYARRRLPSSEAAEDAVSETMSRAVASIGRYRGEGAGLMAWLHGILRNVVLDAQNASRRFSADTAPDVIADEIDPVDRLVRDEEAVRVREAFATLSPAEQEIIELRVVSGLRAEAVGTIVGRRSGAIRMMQSRALAKLRLILDGEVHRAG
jgi:RNA polymerase sigma-70 factor (ECF subfamily)